MNCEQIKELIPGWLDGEVEAFQAKAIEEHIAACESCREEAAFWQAVGTSLREDAGAVKAPAGFTAEVMARLPEGRRNRGFATLVTRWKRGIAAAAAFLLVAAGSAAGYVQWITQPATRVAENPSGQVVNIDPKSGNESKVTNPGPQDDPGNKDPGTQPGKDNTGNNSTGQTGDNNKDNPGPGSTPGKENNEPGAPAARTGNNSERINSEDYALLSIDTNRVVERTLFKVKVADLNAAHRQALAYINGAGAEYEVLGTESTANGGQETIKITVDNPLAGQLVENLKTLGQVGTTDSQKDDITARYNEKVEQYRSLEARVQAVDNPVEREQLQVKMAGIKAQLKAWDKEARTKTIILWLES